MILVVDDNPSITTWLKEVIEQEGYYYDSAVDAVSALFKASRIYYAMALVDIKLPGGVDGDELAKQIKSLPEPYCGVPMVVMTGGTYRKTPDDPFADILRKPFLPRDLEAMILKVARPPIKDLHTARQAMDDPKVIPTGEVAQQVSEDPEVIPTNPDDGHNPNPDPKEG